MLIKTDMYAAGVNTSPFIFDANNALPISSAVASSTYADSRFTVEKSYDGSDATAWLPSTLGSNVPYNVVYDLGSKQDVEMIFLQFATSDGGDYSIDVEISGSNDGTNFDVIIPKTSQFTVSNGWSDQGSSITGKQARLIFANKSYRYFKIAFVRYSGTSTYCPGIGEIMFVDKDV